jgi:hypothetical protein
MAEVPPELKAQIAEAVRIVQSDRDPATAKRAKLKAAGLSDEEIAHLGTYTPPPEPGKEGDPTPPPPKDDPGGPAPEGGKKSRGWWGSALDDPAGPPKDPAA